MSGEAGIFVAVDGEPVDLSEVSWIQIAPCGCVCAASMAYSDYGSGPARVIATAQDAAKSMGSKAERKQDEERGFTWRPIRRTDLQMPECQHEPKWGYEHAPVPDGMGWAVGGYYRDRTRTLHLVPSVSIETDDAKVPREHWTATSLCSAATKVQWDARWHVRDGKVECKRCWKLAAEADQ